MNAPRIHHLVCKHPGGTHRMAWREWCPPASATTPVAGGSASRRTVVCVHGLTRTGGDFDTLAAALVADGYRVVCPDIAGRGLSDWLPEAAMYDIPQYAADCTTLLAALGDEPVDWIGSSMGGLIGMAIAAGATARASRPIARLLLNDVGPVIARAGLRRISTYVGVRGRHRDFDTAVAALRIGMASFGRHDEATYRALARHQFVEREGRWVPHYDPAIVTAFSAVPDGDIVMWPLWDAIDCPVTVLRGGESDLLDAATAESMTRGGPTGTGPRADLVTVAGVGHAPMLIVDDQVAMVRRFLGAGEFRPWSAGAIRNPPETESG